jgi:hypothetical protein
MKMLNEFITKKVWKKPEEGKHVARLLNWKVVEFEATDKREAGDYLECEFLLDGKREIRKNLFEQDVRILASALVNKYFAEGSSLVEMLNRLVGDKREIELWIKYNTKDTTEYINFYWYEPTINDTPTEIDNDAVKKAIAEADIPL